MLKMLAISRYFCALHLAWHETSILFPGRNDDRVKLPAATRAMPRAVQPMTFMMTVHFVKIVNAHQHLERQGWPKV